MYAKLCFLVILAAFVCGLSEAAPLDDNQEQEVRQFLEDSSKTLYNAYDKIVAELLESDKSNKSYSSFLDTYLEITNPVIDIVCKASKYNQIKYKDPELNFILDKLKRNEDWAILRNSSFLEMREAMNNLDYLAAYKDINGYKNDSVQLSYFPDIQNILVKSNDPEEMKYYWNAWRVKNDKFVTGNLMKEVNGMKEAAIKTGISVFDFWVNNFNMTQMDAVMIQLKPVYRQIHGFIRHQLNKKYGDDVISTQGLIPDHLFQQVLAQTWTPGSIIEEMFPYNELPPYDELLIKNNFDTLKIYKTGTKFYETMGFEKFPESYWGKNLKMKSDEDEGDCKALMVTINKDIMFMNYCHKMDFRTFLQAHGYMAEVHSAIERSHLPAYYSDTYDLDYAVGEAVILSAASPKYLKKIGLLSSDELSEQAFLNRLMRLNFHSMLNIPVYYVHTKLMADMFEGKFEMTELNKKYWEMMDKYVGVGPPMDRVYNTFDFSFKFYVDLPENLQARKFMSEVLSYQFYMKLCTISDQYPKGHLQNCDFSDSTVAGDALKKMIKLGESKPFTEVLAALLPEDPKLNADSLMEYYFPAINWLVVNNKQTKVNIGWTHLDKRVDSVKLNEDQVGDD